MKLDQDMKMTLKMLMYPLELMKMTSLMKIRVVIMRRKRKDPLDIELEFNVLFDT